MSFASPRSCRLLPPGQPWDLMPDPGYGSATTFSPPIRRTLSILGCHETDKGRANGCGKVSRTEEILFVLSYDRDVVGIQFVLQSLPGFAGRIKLAMNAKQQRVGGKRTEVWLLSCHSICAPSSCQTLLRFWPSSFWHYYYITYSTYLEVSATNLRGRYVRSGRGIYKLI